MVAFLLPSLWRSSEPPFKAQIISVENENNENYPDVSLRTEDELIFWSIILHYFIILFLISYFRTYRIDPGPVPSYWSTMVIDELNKFDEQIKQAYSAKLLSKSVDYHKNEENDKTFDRNSLSDNGKNSKFEENLLPANLDELKLSEMEDDFLKRKGLERFCSHCQNFKPPRAHHCRECGRCVLKMDHHCPWVLNCIGFYNYKVFFNMLIYGDITILMMICSFSQLIIDKIYYENLEYTELFVLSTGFACMLFVSVLLTAFLFFHFRLLLKGKTTIENCDTKKKKYDYNLGFKENFLCVFGRNPLMWFFPVLSNSKESGVQFSCVE